MNTPQLPLGKLPPRRYYSDVAIKLADYLEPKKLPQPPKPTFAWGSNVSFGTFLNDQLPCCTCSAYAHSEQIHSTRAGHPERPDDEFVRELFHRTGVEQGLTDDQGRYMAGVLRSLRDIGFKQKDGSMEKILGYAAVDAADLTELRSAAWLFGGVYFGAALPMTAWHQHNAGKNWSCGGQGSQTPGSWGGHAMWVTALNKTGPVCATWGKRKQITWCWWNKYVDEVYAVVTDDWADPDKRSPSGFDRAELVADLAEL